MEKLPPLAELRAFGAAARCLSFKLAAAELGATPRFWLIADVRDERRGVRFSVVEPTSFSHPPMLPSDPNVSAG